MDSPQPIGDINMPVQQIELEEVTMVDVGDDILEASSGVMVGSTAVNYAYTPLKNTNECC